jgi:cytochrome c oxidase subunit IV
MKPFVFVSVWAALILLTLSTVFVAGLHAGQASLLMPLLISTVKASLVLWYFMHLKFEGPLFRYLLLLPILTLGVIMGLTFADVGFR